MQALLSDYYIKKYKDMLDIDVVVAHGIVMGVIDDVENIDEAVKEVSEMLGFGPRSRKAYAYTETAWYRLHRLLEKLYLIEVIEHIADKETLMVMESNVVARYMVSERLEPIAAVAYHRREASTLMDDDFAPNRFRFYSISE